MLIVQGAAYYSGGTPNLNNKIIIEQYIMYGLNRNRRFLQLPDGVKTINLATKEDLIDFSIEILKAKECECALFYVHLDGSYSSVFKTIVSEEIDDDVITEDSQILVTYSLCTSLRKKDIHLFSTLDGCYRFCCYSLLVEIEDGVYESV